MINCSNPVVWGVFVGDKGNQLEIFNSKSGPFPPEPGKNGMIYIGWPAIGDLRIYTDNYDDYIEAFRIVYPDDNERAFKTKANMPWYFAFSMKIDDWVICPSSASGLLLAGKIISDYESDFDDKLGLYGRKRADFVHRREVCWLYVVYESDPRYQKLHRIGQLTVSRPDISSKDLQQILNGITPVSNPPALPGTAKV